MERAYRLSPLDLVVAIRLLRPAGTIAAIAADLGVVPSQVHSALKKARLAGLVRPDSNQANRHSLAEFIGHGVRYAFPCRPGTEARGVPTAHSAHPLADDIDAAEAYVWPAAKEPGAVRGLAITPLYPGAVRLRTTSPETYRMLALVDALRVGQARDRALALQHLKRALQSDVA